MQTDYVINILEELRGRMQLLARKIEELKASVDALGGGGDE